MNEQPNLLTPEAIQMLVSSITNSGNNALTELEAERFLNAITRAQSGVPTGVQHHVEPNDRKVKE